MQKRLDPENLGIILLNAFMDEFFPLERRSTPDTFELLHYNGIPGSNENNKVGFSGPLCESVEQCNQLAIKVPFCYHSDSTPPDFR